MRFAHSAWVLAAVSMLACGAASQEIPVGTVFPVMSSTTLDEAKAKPGDKLSARLMQDVILPSGARIRSGAKFEGQVVTASSAGSGGTGLAVRFDRLISRGRQIPLAVGLRALASMQDVFDAQLPVGTFDDFGTSISDWTTVQVGGAAVYLGDATVRDGMQVVGKAPGYGIVMAKLVPAPKRGCQVSEIGPDREQSLWVFSPWACGTYGWDGLTIAHHGVTAPVGTIVLAAPAAFRVRGGSGWLLYVVADDSSAHPASVEQ